MRAPLILNRHALPVPRADQAAAFHRDLARYHERLNCEHRDLEHDEAAEAHAVAAGAHEAAALAPTDPKAHRAAMVASGLADQASQKTGAKP